MNLKFKKATEGDIEYLYDLRVRTMGIHFENTGLKATAEDHMKYLLNEFQHANLILLNGKTIGLLKSRRQEGFVEIMQIQIEPQHQNKGLGRQIIQQIIVDAKEENLKVKLDVLKKNPALRLYKKLGFKVFAEDEHSYYMHIV